MASRLVRRKDASMWLSATFGLLLISTALMTEFFQSPKITSQAFEEFRVLIDQNQVNSIKEMVISNRLGNFKISKNSDEEWFLTEPRNLYANHETIDLILNELKDIKIKEILKKDSINLSNYSLKNPSLELNLFFENNSKNTKIAFGLSNSIDKSSYLIMGDNEFIYHTTEVKLNFEKLGLSSFIDSRIFPFQLADLLEFSIYQYGKRTLYLISKNESFVNGTNGRSFSKEKVESYFNRLFRLGGQFILDQEDEELSQFVKDKLKKPNYKFSFKLKNGSLFESKVSYKINELPTIKVEKGKLHLIKTDSRPHPVLLSKEILKELLIRTRDIY